jgi:hypothetical protein
VTFTGVVTVRRVNVTSIFFMEVVFVLFFAVFIVVGWSHRDVFPSSTSPPSTTEDDNNDDVPIKEAMRMFHNAMQSTIDPNDAIR